MADTIAVFNAGSSTLKVALYARTLDGGVGACRASETFDVETDHADAARAAFERIARHVAPDDLRAIGHRIVHGGARFTAPVAIDDEVVAALDALRPLAPLHQPHGLAIVAAARTRHPHVPQFASFDTAFHATMPPVATHFALPRTWFDRGVRRYGFHGLSYESVVTQLRAACAPDAMRRVVVAHLGSGASLCALRDGASVATTMSFTPTDGLVMATRCGALDPSVVTYLVREHGMDPDAIDRLLNVESGLLGVSGATGDLRALLARDDADARFAVDLFVQRIVEGIGAMVATLGGVDALVFTGGIGTHRSAIRARVCGALDWLGIDCDRERNAADAARFETAASRVALWNVRTDEARVIAEHAAGLLRARAAPT